VTTSGNRIHIESVLDYTLWEEKKEITTIFKNDIHITLEASDFSDYSTYKLIGIRAKKYYDYHRHHIIYDEDYDEYLTTETDVELNVNAFFNEVDSEDTYISFDFGPILPQHVKKWDWSFTSKTSKGGSTPEGGYEKDSFSSFLFDPDGRITLKLNIKTEE
jgi:hypothetical protein